MRLPIHHRDHPRRLGVRRGQGRPSGPDSANDSSVAFVFSGGGSHGAIQVGQARALLDAGIRPDLLVGCSVGALNAAFLSADPTPDGARRLEAAWLAITTKDVFGSTKRQTISNVVRRADHLLEPTGLRSLIRRFCPMQDLSEAAVPCHIVTTDLEGGLACWWSAGPAEDILAASACLPGLFPPVTLPDGQGGVRLHVDGGVLTPVPAERALDLGATLVYVLDASFNEHPSAEKLAHMSALDVLLQSFAVTRTALMTNRPISPAPGQRVVTLPRCDASHIDIRDLSHTHRLIDDSYLLAREFLAGLDHGQPEDALGHGVITRLTARG